MDADPAARELLADYPVVVTQAVVWGEMDAFQHVNNTVYFRYFENVRLAYFERLGWSGPEAGTGIGPILASTHARFRKPLAYPDTISVGARVSEMGADRFTMDYRIVSHRLGAVVTDGQGVIVAYHYGENRKATLPDEVRRRIEALQSGGRGA